MTKRRLDSCLRRNDKKGGMTKIGIASGFALAMTKKKMPVDGTRHEVHIRKISPRPSFTPLLKKGESLSLPKMEAGGIF
jgi:hypothetical protein